MSATIQYKNITNMMNFKEFINQQINYYATHFKRKFVLQDYNGDYLQEINLSFDHLSDEYLKYTEEESSQIENNKQELSSNFGNFDKNQIKITDKDLSQFWQYLDDSYNLNLNMEGQNIGDETILKISELYRDHRCSFRKLNFSGNERITAVGIAKLGQNLQQFKNIEQINLHKLQIEQSGINRIIELIAVTKLTNVDLGIINNNSLIYLSGILENQHSLESISFGESSKCSWNQQGKRTFQNCIRKNEFSKQILAINLYPDNVVNHYNMINELNILCKKNRSLKVDQRENEFKSASLNPNHPKYYEPDNHSLNAYKFSVKSYLNNVFGSLLDQALYFLEKERRNSLREEAIFNITQEPINKIILEDICTADGSIIVLTKYLLGKIKQKDNHK